MIKALLLSCLLVVGAAGCGAAEPTTIDVLVHIKPDSLNPATSLYAQAFLNSMPAMQSFEFDNAPLDHFWVRMPASIGGGVLRLDIAARDSNRCAVWDGSIETVIGPPYHQETTAVLMSVSPPRC